jgi:hypothetical protein
MKKHEIAVFIENEEMLREAMELLEKYGEKYHFIWEKEEDNFLCLSGSTKWGVYGYVLKEVIITLPQLEEILKNQ